MSEPEKKRKGTIFTSEGSPVFEFDGPGDNTRRPRRPNNPREWPPPPKPSSGEQPPESKPPADQPPSAEDSGK